MEGERKVKKARKEEIWRSIVEREGLENLSEQAHDYAITSGLLMGYVVCFQIIIIIVVIILVIVCFK